MVDLAQNTNYLTKLLRNLCPLLENNSFFLGCLNPAPGFSTFTIRGQLKPGINLGAEVPFWDDPMVALGLAFSSLPEFRLRATETRTGIALAFVLQYHFHYHHHLFLNREGRWGTTDDLTTSFLHFSLFSTALCD